MSFIDLEDFCRDFLARSFCTGAANLGVCNAISYEPLDPAVFNTKGSFLAQNPILRDWNFQSYCPKGIMLIKIWN